MAQMDRPSADLAYQRELDGLLEQVLFMGARVEALFVDSMCCFLLRDAARASELTTAVEGIRHLEEGIDSSCVEILSRRQALASELRFIAMAFKIARDLQRVGGLASGICRLAVDSAEETHPHPLIGLEHLGTTAREMLRRALDAYVARDLLLAGEVVAWDRQLDEQYRALGAEIAERISHAPMIVPGLIRLLSVAKAVERVADHAVSVAEMVIFMVEGTSRRPNRRVLARIGDCR